MTAQEKVIQIARAEIGYLEKASNSQLDDKTANAGSNNYTKYARDLDSMGVYNGAKNGYPWCDVFVDWCFIQSFGIDVAMAMTGQPMGGYGAGCTQSAGYYKSLGRFYKNDPQPGDQIFFTDETSIYHTGLVYKVDSSKVYTVEGNTSNVNYVDGNGGKVCKKSYPLGASCIAGYGRPKYDKTTIEVDIEEEEKEEPKKHIIDVDGKWGEDTTRKAQEIFKTTVDGIVTDQRAEYKSANPGLLAFEWKSNPAGYSELIKAIQKKVGATQDGWIGPNTIKKMQKYFDTAQDGCVSNPSDVVKAFQKWLNKQ